MADIFTGISIGVIITLMFNGAINSIYTILFKDWFERKLRLFKEKFQHHGKKISYGFIERIKHKQQNIKSTPKEFWE